MPIRVSASMPGLAQAWKIPNMMELETCLSTVQQGAGTSQIWKKLHDYLPHNHELFLEKGGVKPPEGRDCWPI